MAFVVPKIAKIKTDRLVFGCGNFFYPRARNSIGLQTVNQMAKVFQLPEWKLKKKQYCWYTAGADFFLVRPRVYPIVEMPRALKRAMNFLGVESVKNVTIIHHDPIVPVGHFYSTFGDLPPHIENLDGISRVLGHQDFHRIGVGCGPLEGEKLYVNHTLRSLVEKPMDNEELSRCYEYNKFPDAQMKVLEEAIFTEETLKAMIYTMLHPTESFRSGEAIFPEPKLPPGEPSFSQILGALRMGGQDLLQK